MFRSSSFQKHYSKLEKQHRNDPADVFQTALREPFADACRPIPDEMRDDLFVYVASETFEKGRDPVLFGDVIDLVWQDYDDHADPFSREDWEYLKDLVDAYAHDLEIDFVQYVMERVVGHGLI